ncbi:LysR family transcriptional regulator [Promicromonospora sp. NPDC052451]|uniref:LysR family transcriptional regulator n=1 Tax=Promicromonospora sp. NPDC052451 TaxID=3364407 RepID=UPI0037C91A29
MERGPDLEALTALAAVAESGSLTAAAGRLGVTQQAVSLRIRSLESRLDVVLLSRSPRGSTLTAVGELVVAWAEPLLAAAREFTDSVESLRAGRGRTLRVAASLTIAEHLLPEWIARWRASVGDASPAVQLSTANSIGVADAVRGGTVELGFIEAPTVPADLGSVTIAQDEVVIVVPAGHPWARRGTVSPEILARTSLVLREPGSGTRQALEDALAAAGHPLAAEPAAVLSTTLGVRSTVTAGTAPGALSSLAAREDVRAGRMVPVRIEGVRAVRPLTAVWAGARPPRGVRDLLDTIGRLARRMPVATNVP